MLEVLLIFSLVLFCYLQFHWNRRRLYKLASTVPGPKPWPIMGNLMDVLEHRHKIFDYIRRFSDTYPDIGKFWFGPALIYLVIKPEYLEIVLNSPNALSKSYFYQYLEPLLGWGLASAPVSVWKRHRKIIAPTFNNRILEAGIDTVNQESIILVQQMLKKAGEGFFDSLPFTLKCFLDIFCGTAMDFKTHMQTNGSHFYASLDKVNEIIISRVLGLKYHFDFTFKFTQTKTDLDSSSRALNGVTQRIVQERRTMYKGNSKKIFLDMLLEASSSEENKLSDCEVRDEVKTFLFGGSDTTSKAISYLMMLLGMYPEVQEKILAEVLEVVGSEDAPILWEHLSQLKYTEQAIKETLRLFPPVSFISREATGEIPLGDGRSLARGSLIGLNIIHVHRNPKYWPDPLKFDPERFSPQEIFKRHPYTYLPFSGGPRNCIGMKYAMMSMKIMVGWLVRNITFSTKYSIVEEIRLRQEMMLAPVEGYMIAVEKR